MENDVLIHRLCVNITILECKFNAVVIALYVAVEC